MKKQSVVIIFLVVGIGVAVGGLLFVRSRRRQPTFLEQGLNTMAVEGWRYVQQKRNPNITEDQLVDTMAEVQQEVAKYNTWVEEQKRLCENACQPTYHREWVDNSAARFLEPFYFFELKERVCRISLTIIEDSASTYYKVFNCATGRILLQYHKTRREPWDWQKKEYEEYVRQRDEYMGLNSRN
ncbi:MAG: hypothetical protein PHI63_05065 [Patescibacteria group bacterium]|nr:hypothetical protein [Patescibacteria group bacterium]